MISSYKGQLARYFYDLGVYSSSHFTQIASLCANTIHTQRQTLDLQPSPKTSLPVLPSPPPVSDSSAHLATQAKNRGASCKNKAKTYIFM